MPTEPSGICFEVWLLMPRYRGKHWNASGRSESQGQLMPEIDFHLCACWKANWPARQNRCLMMEKTKKKMLVFLQLTPKLGATPSWLWRICSRQSSRLTTRRPNGSMVSNPQQRLYLLESRAILLIPAAVDGVWHWKGWKTHETTGCAVSMRFPLLSRWIWNRFWWHFIVSSSQMKLPSGSLSSCFFKWQNRHKCSELIAWIIQRLSSAACCCTYNRFVQKHSRNLTWHKRRFEELCSCWNKANSSAAFVRRRRGDVSLHRLSGFVMEAHWNSEQTVHFWTKLPCFNPALLCMCLCKCRHLDLFCLSLFTLYWFLICQKGIIC